MCRASEADWCLCPTSRNCDLDGLDYGQGIESFKMSASESYFHPDTLGNHFH